MEETKKEEHHPTHEVKHETHEIHHPVHHATRKKTNYWMYASIVLIVILAVSVYLNWKAPGSGGLSTTEASTKIMTFINGNLMQPGMEAELKNIEEANGVYIVDLTVAGQDFKSYVSKDGEIFFPQGYVLKELEAELAATKTGAEEMATAAAVVKSDKPNVKMFVMTFCPFGHQAENGLGPALKALGDKVEFEPHFVIYSNYAKNKGASWRDYCFDEAEQYCSMHGIGELNEGIRQLCVFSETPAKWWDYVNAINSKCNYRDIDTCWEEVAKEVGLDTAAIKKCFDDKGELFLKKEVLLNKQFGVRGSPTVLINDAAFNGGRAPEDYKQGICDAFNTAPDACEETLSTTGAAASGGCAS